jgi:hypothetical protein
MTAHRITSFSGLMFLGEIGEVELFKCAAEVSELRRFRPLRWIA